MERIWAILAIIFVTISSLVSYPTLGHAQEAQPCFSVEEFRPYGDILKEIDEPAGSGILAGMQIKFKFSWTAPPGWVIENNGRRVPNVSPGATVTVWSPESCRPMARTSHHVAPAVPVHKTVTMVNFAFRPSNITIRSGETVTWHNQSRLAHSVVSGGAWWGTVEPGQSFPVDIWTPGWYSYVCGFHSQMQGTIVVTE